MILAILLLLSNPQQPRIQVDMIELNHRYDSSTGEPQLHQIILHRWSPDYRRFDVIHWVFHEEHIRILHGHGWHVYDKFAAPLFIETWTWHDPEVEQKRLFPVIYREGLIPR